MHDPRSRPRPRSRRARHCQRGVRRAERASQFASAEIRAVVDAGLMGPSVEAFRPDDPLTASELAVVVSSLGGAIVADPMRSAPSRARRTARVARRSCPRRSGQAVRARRRDRPPAPGSAPRRSPDSVGLRINHPREEDELELQVTQPVTRAEAAYSIATYMKLSEAKLEATRTEADAFSLPPLSEWQRVVLDRALRLVGSAVRVGRDLGEAAAAVRRAAAGRLRLLGVRLAGLQDEAVRGRPGLSRVLVGRTTYAMSGEVPRSLRVGRDLSRPVTSPSVHKGPARPGEAGHMGTHVGND